jgi:ABC-type nitrate/sulfonate/bicarbonate transport system substrate-binding protein
MIARATVAALALAGLTSLVPSRAAVADDTVTVQLRATHQARFAGLYVADATKLYRAEGLAVRHREWRLGDRSPVEQVVSGAADFGITGQAQFLVAREQGARIVALAAVFQRPSVVFVALKRSNLTHPREFAGKTIAFAPPHEAALQGLLKRVGVDVKDLKRAPYGGDLAPFYRGETAIWAGHAIEQPVDARLAGHDVTVIFPDDYGVQGYDDILFASEDLVRRKPALVERWIRAALRGWRHAIAHADEATTITCALDDTLKRDRQAAMLRASIPLVQGGDRPVGWMTREVWQAAAALLHEHRALTRMPAVDGMFTTVFVRRAGR